MKLFHHKMYVQLILLSLTLLFSVVSHALSPELLSRLKKENIVDITETLSRDEIKDLKQQNEQLYLKNKVDLKILIMYSIGSIPIEEFANDIFSSTQIGSKELDNGLLLVIAKDDRKMRLEVGYGLEGDLTDLEAGRIIRNTLAPNFKNEQYYQGLHQTQQILINKNITFNEAKIKRHHLFLHIKTACLILLSFILCIPIFWVYKEALISSSPGIAIPFFILFIVVEVFIHVFIFAVWLEPKTYYFICLLVPIYSPLLLAIFLPKNLSHRVLKVILYSLPFLIFSALPLWLFSKGNFYPEIFQFIFIFIGLALLLIVMYLRYLQFMYRFKNGTENAYLTSFYNNYLKEQERKRMIKERYERLDKLRGSDQINSSTTSSSFSSSSSSSNSSSSSSSRDSGGSSGGGGASGSW